jgi:hypothetical protein
VATSIAAGRRIFKALMADLGGKKVVLAGVMPVVQDLAIRNASAHPTPQSRIAATGLKVAGPQRNWLMVPKSSGLAGALAGGSEWGGKRYRQFGPPRSSPAWLNSLAEREDPAIASALERTINELLEAHT